jgi:hypothetical protein
MANITINSEGKQLGPLTMEAARSMVLTGAIRATDWAWIDGATEWVPLHSLPGFVPSPQNQQTVQKPPAVIGASVGRTPRVAQAVPQAAQNSPDQEQILWTGSPSQLLNLAFYVKAAIALIGIRFVGFSKETADIRAFAQVPDFVPELVFFPLLVLCILRAIMLTIQVLSTRYVVTTQRVKVFRGIFSKDVQEIELFRAKDTSAHQTFFLRMFGIGNMRVLSGDASAPNLVLLAIPKPFELRERLRNEIIILRQRFNVREMELM